MVDNRNLQAIIDVDNERLKFWKSGKLLTSIPKSILSLTGWLEANEDTQLVAELPQSSVAATPRMLGREEDYSIVFRVPRDNADRERLEVILTLLRKLQSDNRHADNLIRQRAAEGKDVERLQKDKQWLTRTRGALYGRVNSFLDTLRFEITDMGLEEMRYQAPAKRMYVEQLRRDMDND